MSTVDPRRNICLMPIGLRPSGCGVRIGVYAYIPAPTITTTTLAATYYPIAGPFTNTVIEQFTLGVDSIIYSYTTSLFVKIVYSGTFESDTNNTTLTVAARRNGIVLPGSTGSFKIKTIGDSGSVSASVVIEINHGDAIQLVLQSDQAGAQITASTFSTSLSRFFVDGEG